MSHKIVVIDDEVSVCRFLKHSLESQGYIVKEAHTGAEGLQKIISEKPNMVILDFGLPDQTGLEVLRKLREWSQIPVLFLTVRDTDDEKVAALDHGADDYMTKPFSVPELLARIRLALRHAKQETEEPLFKTGSLEINRSAHIVKAGGKEVKLTATEYALLNLLAKHAGKLVPHRKILKDVWGPNSVEHDHYLRVYFSQIRKKLEIGCKGLGDLIENESGVGYRLKIIN